MLQLQQQRKQQQNNNNHNGGITCRMSIEAYSKAEFLRPDLWHSMTVDVNTGTMCFGKREILRATLKSIRAAPSWSPRRTIFFT